MKLLALMMALLASSFSAFATEQVFYLAAGDGIYCGSLNDATGQLAPLQLAISAAHANFLTLSLDHATLFAALEASVASYRVGKDNSLAALNEVPAGGEGTCHVTLGPRGTSLFAANYGGNLAEFSVAPNGLLGQSPVWIPFSGSGPNTSRQEGPHIHGSFVTPDGRFLYVCDLGSDRVWILPLNLNGEIASPTDTPQSAALPPGSGPRHIAFSEDGQYTYVANELGRSVTTFVRDQETGALVLLKTISDCGTSQPAANVSTAEIMRHPNGRWVYVSNRGSDTIAQFGIGADGSLRFIQEVPCGVKSPRSFAIDGTGHWLIAVGERDGRLNVLKLDPATGTLTATDQSVSGPKLPDCVLFMR